MNRGQAALIVLLVVAVALGFGLSIISQSTTDVRIAKEEQESARAFNAAEAGIEEALKNISTIALGVPQAISGLGEGVTSNYVVETANQLTAVYQENDTVQVNLADHDPDLTTVTVNWVKANNSTENPGCSGEDTTPASLVITLIKGAAYGYAQRNFAYNTCDALNNGMTNITTPGDSGYLRKVSVAIEAGDELMRLRPVYNQASFWVLGNVDLPSQGYAIASSAQVLSGDQSLATKAIEVTRTEPATPAIFDYVLFSGTNLVK